jgi:CxxC motif-containing protein (DUF1111 family)
MMRHKVEASTRAAATQGHERGHRRGRPALVWAGATSGRGARILAVIGGACALGVGCSDAFDIESDVGEAQLELCAGARNPYGRVEAESSNASQGVIFETTADTGGGQNAGSLKNGDWLRFTSVDFGSPGANHVNARVASGAAGGVSGLVEFHLDSPTGTIAGSFAIANTGGWQTWQTIPANVQATGLHDLYIVFKSGQPADFVNLNWVEFQGNAGTGSCPGTSSSSSSSSSASSSSSSSSSASSSGAGGAGGGGGTGGTGGTGGAGGAGSIVPLYTAATPKMPALSETLPNGTVITRFGGRVRDRHARENQFQAYQHWLPLYFQARTMGVEIIDTIPAGGTTITFNMTTPYPHNGSNFRIFFLGNNTVAEYFINTTFNAVDDFHYTQTISFNNPKNRNFQVGDLMEFEIGVFLREPVEGRFNYYSDAWLYRAGQPGLVAWQGTGTNRDSVPLGATSLLGGKTTDSRNESNEPESSLMQMALNIAPANTQPFVEGRRQHHTSFIDGSHSESGNPVLATAVGKAGPTYNEASCIACHARNGRSQPPETTGTAIHNMLLKVGELAGSTFVAHSQYGRQLQTRAVSGSTAEGTLSVGSFQTSTVQATDGTVFTLQKPIFSVQSSSSIAYSSARTAPPLVGTGLLEAIDEATVLGMADPNDANGDGISGRASVVADVKTGQARLGRFGWKAERASLRQQIAVALREDIGVTTSLFPGAGNQIELSDADLDRFERYTGLLAVSPQRTATDPTVQAGQTLFTTAGCTSCHVTSITTGSNHPMAELRNQPIKPFTDLLLHDMGDALASTLPGDGATAREWRTAPLWNIGLASAIAGKSARYLHDGRARTLLEAVLWHGGEADAARTRVLQLNATQRNQLLAFLQSL